jgi:hypothetical protein
MTCSSIYLTAARALSNDAAGSATEEMPSALLLALAHGLAPLFLEEAKWFANTTSLEIPNQH